MDTRAIEQMIGQMQAASEVAGGKASASTAAGGADFSVALQNAMAEVSQAQQSAQQMAQDFSAGNSEVNLQDVMVNLQKANLSFQQMVQVRNKLVSAYQDIMNMQV
ncbi:MULTISPECIES: flagellar hook-basal body complex protein FliE [Uliginosibacterium]|uniref:Flagellar hook-basal body complex protein FliE n=1 Tax=Uliginosibacterium aquaticum TaxID=2731212 RepID=A0ABX2IE12_9RHOO|nr:MULTISPECIES: flagellar hook-basal body complex protein FliE [Uliginosibacterium]MDO6387972.1 flagellar hook-basal body complex protein FliE [Uliginosibacterium sp. 31-12]NSL54839.1 flagellar hook-basal body complex protein FliE [Uliginosibacterium aquaticum]PLK48111.1 flagellar hook-basal body complex protein FliE [Uliginosibacterium sp. TH139]